MRKDNEKELEMLNASSRERKKKNKEEADYV